MSIHNGGIIFGFEAKAYGRDFFQLFLIKAKTLGNRCGATN